jgi:mannose-1-phosphate guanylyltransferase
MKAKKPTQAVVLVGGEGTRLRPLTYTTVKAMVPVLNKPFIHYAICHLNSHSVNEIILAMGYKPDSIKNYFEKTGGIGTNLVYSMEQVPLGTAGAVKNAAKYITKDDAFFVINGDILTDLDLTEMLNFHKNKRAKVTIALTPVDDPTQFGVVELDGQQRVTRFLEKPSQQEVTSNLINAGTYILEPEILARIPPGKKFMFERDVFPQLIADREPIYGYSANAYWIDIGIPEKYLRLNHDLLLDKCHPINFQAETIYLNTLSVYPQAGLYGPVVIDKGCTIGKNVQIKGPSVIGSECNIGNDAIIEGSVLWTKVMVGERATIKNCIICNDMYVENNAHIENIVIGKNTAAQANIVNMKTNSGGNNHV